ncbi:MAG: methyltransferase domain-containing protein [Candidatus Lokiarchaeota archaeon]|nr:methyltransferase domain-containing protein [Candidatus Lokiarchaeota archaeon]
MKKRKSVEMSYKKTNKFWHERAVHYDKLFWTKDKEYLDIIIEMSDFKKDDLVLDVGVGTGAVAKKIKPFVKHVIGIDISESMLEKGEWEGISTIKWNISDALFTNNIFDKIVARMVFHHMVENLDIAIMRCYDLLKKYGKIIVAEGVPPTDEIYIIEWYTKMFKLKEERLTFTCEELLNRLKKIGFKNIKVHKYIMKNFSIKNWLINSGLEQKMQDKILKMHLSANKKIQNAYNMQYINNDCLVDTKNIILVGKK